MFYLVGCDLTEKFFFFFSLHYSNSMKGWLLYNSFEASHLSPHFVVVLVLLLRCKLITTVNHVKILKKNTNQTLSRQYSHEGTFKI